MASDFYKYQVQRGYFPLSYLSIMAYEYELQSNELKNMILLLNSDNFLQEDSPSIAKAILLAIRLEYYSVAYDIFTNIFLEHKRQNPDYADKQFCLCLITIIENFLRFMPKILLVDGMVEELLHSFISLDYGLELHDIYIYIYQPSHYNIISQMRP